MWSVRVCMSGSIPTETIKPIYAVHREFQFNGLAPRRHPTIYVYSDRMDLIDLKFKFLMRASVHVDAKRFLK